MYCYLFLLVTKCLAVHVIILYIHTSNIILMCFFIFFYFCLDISECPYDRSEKILGSQDLGLVFMAQAFENESNRIHISGVQFLHMGQAFNKPLGAINIIGPLFGMKLWHHNYITTEKL